MPDPRRQLVGRRSKASGETFERWISNACEFYLQNGWAHIEKTPEPFHITGKDRDGRRIILVGDYKKVCRCKVCGKIYDKGIPYICSKCGAEIGRPTPTILQMMGSGEVTLTEKCEKVVAKKGLFGWRVREPQNPEVIQE